MGCDSGSEPDAVAAEPQPAPATATASPSRIELLGAEGNPEAIEAFAAVSAAYEAFNASDMVTWATSYIDFPRSLDPEAYDNEVGYLQAARAVGAHYDVASCDYVGLVERDIAPDEADEPNVAIGHAFNCETTMTDPFTEAAAIDFVEQIGWLVTDGALIVDGGDFIARNQLRRFLGDFTTWLRLHHPDVRNSMAIVNWYNYPVADDIPAALDLLDEFVESRDNRPDEVPDATATAAQTPPPIELRGADGRPEAVDAFATVSAAFAAFNAGDAVGWMIPVRADGTPQPPLQEDDDELEYTRARNAAGARFENGACEYEEVDAEPLSSTKDTEGSVARHQFQCTMIYVDTFTIAAGIDAVEEYAFLVADDGTPVETLNSGPDGELRGFMSDLAVWLAADHPELAASMRTNAPPTYPLAKDIPAVVELLDDFVEANQRWPVSTKVPATQPIGSGPPSADASGAAPSGGTPLPDVDGAVAGDDGSSPLPLGVVATVPETERLDFLFEFCGWHGPGCFRDAHLMDPDDPNMGSGAFTAGRPFHIRHGFVNDGPETLGPGFDLVVYVTPLDLPGEHGGHALGATVRYTSDYVVRGTADRCGPQYRAQAGPVTCEWFVHEFPDGLPEGRHAIWAMWEAPCQAWLEWGFSSSCADPDATLSLFTSGYDGPYGAARPQFTERNEVGRDADEALAA